MNRTLPCSFLILVTVTFLEKLTPGGCQLFDLRYSALILGLIVAVELLGIGKETKRFCQALLFSGLMLGYTLVARNCSEVFIVAPLAVLALTALYRLFGPLWQSLIVFAGLALFPQSNYLILYFCIAVQSIWVSNLGFSDNGESSEEKLFSSRTALILLLSVHLTLSLILNGLYVLYNSEVSPFLLIASLSLVITIVAARSFTKYPVLGFLLCSTFMQLSAVLQHFGSHELVVIVSVSMLLLPMAFVVPNQTALVLALISGFLPSTIYKLSSFNLIIAYWGTIFLTAAVSFLYHSILVKRIWESWLDLKETDSQIVFDSDVDEFNYSVDELVERRSMQLTSALVFAISVILVSVLTILVTAEEFASSFSVKAIYVAIVALAGTSYGLLRVPFRTETFRPYILCTLAVLVLLTFYGASSIPILIMANVFLVLFAPLTLKDYLALYVFCLFSTIHFLQEQGQGSYVTTASFVLWLCLLINRIVTSHLRLQWAFEELVLSSLNVKSPGLLRILFVRGVITLLGVREAVFSEPGNTQYYLNGNQVTRLERWSWPLKGLRTKAKKDLQIFWWLPGDGLDFRVRHGVLITFFDDSLALVKEPNVLMLVASVHKLRKVSLLKNALQSHFSGNQEIEEVKRALSRLGTANKKNESHFSAIVHDVNNTVQDLVIACEEITGKFPEDSKEHSALKKISEQAYSVSTVLVDAKRSRELMGDSQLGQAEQVCLQEVVYETVKHAKLRAERISGMVELINELREPVYIETIGREYLTSSVRNLLTNAIQYGGSGVKVSVELRLRGEMVEVVVADNGPGVKEEDRENIFSEGFRGGRGYGLGIGLYNARKVVEASDGTLELVPEESGAKFVMKMPVVKNPAEAENWVFIADEGEAILNFYKSVLANLDLQVKLVQSFEEGLKVVENRRAPRFIVCDLEIGGVPGTELIKKAKSKWGASVPIVIVTGVRDSELESEILGLGVSQVVYKPVSRKALFSVLEGLAG